MGNTTTTPGTQTDNQSALDRLKQFISRQAPTNRRSVTVLSGPLGAGKTTTLNHILTADHDTDVAVLVNDMGEVNVDAEHVARQSSLDNRGEPLLELSNGCICCRLRGDLLDGIEALANERDFDHLLVETSGISEPAPVANTFQQGISDSGYDPRTDYRLDSLVTVLDARALADYFESGEALMGDSAIETTGAVPEQVLMQQIEFCDLLVLNKCDLVTDEDIETIEQTLEMLQPRADVLPTTFGEIDPTVLFEKRHFGERETKTGAGWKQLLYGDAKEFSDLSGASSTGREDPVGDTTAETGDTIEESTAGRSGTSIAEDNHGRSGVEEALHDHGDGASHSYADGTTEHHHDGNGSSGDHHGSDGDDHHHHDGNGSSGDHHGSDGDDHHHHDGNGSSGDHHDHDADDHHHHDGSGSSGCHHDDDADDHHHHGDCCEDGTCEPCGHDEGHRAHYDVSSTVFRASRPVHPERFSQFLDGLPETVIRAKGFFWVAGREGVSMGLDVAGNSVRAGPKGRWIATLPADQQAQYREIAPALDEKWDEEWGDRGIELVFIGRDLEVDMIHKDLSSCLLTDEEMEESWSTYSDPFGTDGQKEFGLNTTA